MTDPLTDRLLRVMPVRGPAAVTPPPQPRKLVGHYEVVREVGRGGMGVVYEAYDPRLRRAAAVKMPLSLPHPEVIPRFQTEAEAMAKLAHPHIVRVYDIGWSGGLPFVAVEFLSGGSLSDRTKGKPQPPRDAAELVKTLAGAVAHAHANGVVHRDLKPANILFDPDGAAKLTDFGVARLLAADATHIGHGLTQMGQAVGTPQYMAPEQARGGPTAADPPVDVYALGAMLYELLTGRPPHDGADGYAVLEAVINTDPVPPRRLVPGLARDLDTICLTALERHPAKRYPSAEALAADLGRYLAGEPIRARPAGFAERTWKKARRRPLVAGLVLALAGVVAAGLGGVGWQWNRAVAGWAAAEANARDAETARDAATAEKANAEAQAENARRSLHDAKLSVTARLIQAGETAQARNELARTADRGWEWHHLHRLARPYLWQVPTAGGAGLWPQVTAVSPDGARVATFVGNPYKHSTLWDRDQPADLDITPLGTGRQTHRLAGVLPGRAAQVVWLDADRLAAIDRFGSLAVVTLDGAKARVARHRVPLTVAHGVFDLARLSPDGRWLARGSSRGEVVATDPATGREVGRFTPTPGQPAIVTDLHPSGLAAVRVGKPDEPGELVLVDLPAGTMRGRVPAAGVRAVILPDGSRVAATVGPHGAGGLGVWQADGRPVWERPHGGGAPAAFLLATPDGRHLVESQWDSKRPRVWDAATGGVRFDLVGHTGYVSAVGLAPDGRTLATGGHDGAVRLWSLTDGRQLAALHGHQNGPRAVAFDPFAARLVSGGMDGTLAAWDLTRGGGDGSHLERVEPDRRGRFADPARFGGLWATADGAGWVFHTNAAGARLVRFDPTGFVPDRLVLLRDLAARAGDYNIDFALSPDGTRLLGAAAPTRVGLWDTATGQPTGPLPELPPMAVMAAAFSRDGALAAVSGPSRTANGLLEHHLRVWETATGRVVFAQDGRSDWYTGLAFLPDGRLALGRNTGDSGPGGLHLLDPRTGTKQPLDVPDPTLVRSVVVSADGKLAAAVCLSRVQPSGNKVYVWNLAAGKLAWVKADVGLTTGLAFSPDGKRLAAARCDDRVVLWRTDTGGLVLIKAPDTDRMGDGSFPARAAFTPDGRRLLANHASDRLSVWAADPDDDPSADRAAEAERAAFGFHLRAAFELAGDPAGVGFRLHLRRLAGLPPPGPRAAELREQLPKAER